MTTSVTARWNFTVLLAYRRVGQPSPRVVRLESVSSTQDAARALPIGSIVVADHQTAGRGRLDRSWESRPGSALLVSFVLPPNLLLSLAAGVAAAEACGSGVRLKWPNDLLLGGAKLGGILVEATPGKAICGIGINLGWSPTGAARLDEDRDRLLEKLRVELQRWSAAKPEVVLARWRELSDTLGRRVRVELPGSVIVGTAEDIGPGGELIVDGVSVTVGSVTHL
jgi:BirA family transcriptional regulator, biotin operon repressor / biotin---[acetyl-CoA-carboxylase] ligase